MSLIGIEWEELRTARPGWHDVALFDSTVLVGGEIGRGWQNANGEYQKYVQRKLRDAMTEGKVPDYALILPDFILHQSAAVLGKNLDRPLTGWLRKAAYNRNVACYTIGTPLSCLGYHGYDHKFRAVENTFPEEWRETARSIDTNLEDSRGRMTDRALIYAALHVHDNHPEANLSIVSDDRRHVTTGPMTTALNRYNLRLRSRLGRNVGRLEVCKSGNFYNQLQKRAFQQKPAV